MSIVEDHFDPNNRHLVADDALQEQDQKDKKEGTSRGHHEGMISRRFGRVRKINY